MEGGVFLRRTISAAVVVVVVLLVNPVYTTLGTYKRDGQETRSASPDVRSPALGAGPTRPLKDSEGMRCFRMSVDNSPAAVRSPQLETGRSAGTGTHVSEQTKK